MKKVIPLYKEDNKLLPGNATYNMQLDLWAMGSNWQYDNDAKIVVMGNGEILFDEVVSNGYYCNDPYTAYSKPFWRYNTQWFKCYVKLNINFQSDIDVFELKIYDANTQHWTFWAFSHLIIKRINGPHLLDIGYRLFYEDEVKANQTVKSNGWSHMKDNLLTNLKITSFDGKTIWML